MRSRLALVFLATVSCASQPVSPFMGDERFLRFGVEPDQEANAVIEDQRERGYVVARKLAGQYFTALGFMEPSGRSMAVRVITAHGITLALDPERATPLAPAVSYALLAQPIPNTQDADKDGFEEVFVERRTGEMNCIQVYRIRDVGFVDPVTLDTRVFGQDFCPNTVLDLDGDGSAELLADVLLRGFEPLGPQVRVVLWARDHRFEVDGDPNRGAHFAQAERPERERALVQARAHEDVDSLMRLGIELAGYARLSGREPNAQVQELDAAVSGAVLSPAQTTSLLAARARIFSDWNTPASPSGSTAGKEAARP